MTYEKTKVKKTISREAGRRYVDNQLSSYATGVLLMHLVKRHRFGLVTAWAVIMTLLYLMPFLPDVLATIIL